MTPERWAEVQRLFESALTMREPERRAFVATQASDAEVATLVMGLLDADAAEQSGKGRLIEVVGEAMTALADGPPPAERLGPYKLLELLGEGGMGAVYLAERDDDEFLQRVAVKVVRGGLNRERVRQFRAERQILAWLEHPNIARLLDGGTTEAGLPYLVMEHVEGLPIDRHADANRLTVRQRLGLFLEVCEGLSHAHRNLIVHRDIKPNNIVVTDDGVPKLLDFGIARLVVDGVVTPSHGRMMTPDYASPEVVRGGHVTTAADVYALGVLLYELLTGDRPLRFASMTTAEIEQVVCHQEPLLASAVVSSTDAAHDPHHALSHRAALRGTTPPALRRALAGDLDAIVGRALQKDPGRRYPSVEALADDIRRHLAGRPVGARPASAWYVAERAVRRHPWTAVGLVASAALVGAVAVSAAHRGRQLADERDQLARERDNARAAATFVTGLLAAPGDDASLTLPDALERGADRAALALAGQPVVQADVLLWLGEALGRAGRPDPALGLLQRAVELRRGTLGPAHADTATAVATLTGVLRDVGRHAEAEPLDRHALDVRRASGPPLAVAGSLLGLGLDLAGLGRPQDAEPLLREAATIRAAHAPTDVAGRADALGALAEVLSRQGRAAEARAELDAAVQAVRTHQRGGDLPLADLLSRLARLKLSLSDGPGAEPLLREALAIRRRLQGDGHPATTGAFNQLAVAEEAAGRVAEAESLLRAAVAGIRAQYGEAHASYRAELELLAGLLERVDRTVGAVGQGKLP